jgi:hypothetical protein
VEWRRNILCAVLEGEIDGETLDAQLFALETENCVKRLMVEDADGEIDPLYTFPHSSFQEVLYNLLLFSQRRALHATIARYYESMNKPVYSSLLHHWILSLEEGV